MSEDGFPDPYDEPSMELTVETLTGTTFEMRVYPTDTVLDIKNKIQRVEGIPVHHQNLLYQMKELQDYTVLADHGITNGCTLKLVLSMRGGPISTRRLTTCDHQIIWRDIKELIEHSRDEGNERSSKLSVLVYKEGDVLVVVRVIENEDGSYSPYTEKAVTPPQSSIGGPLLAPIQPSSSTIHPTTEHKSKREQAKDMRDQVHQILSKKLTEDMEMAIKLFTLKTRMRRLREQRQTRDLDLSKPGDNAASASDDMLDDNADIELGELALKEKHRTRSNRSSHGCMRNLHVFDPERRDLLPVHNNDDIGFGTLNRVRLARLGLLVNDDQELALEETATQQELAACAPTQCKVGLIQRRTSLDYDSDFGMGLGLDPNTSDVEPDDLFYRLPSIPRFTTTASTSTSAMQQPSKCDLYIDSGQISDKLTSRSPLYGRLSRNSNDNFLPPLTNSPSPDLQEKNSSNIERLQNDFIDYDDLEQDVFGYYNNEFDKYITSGIPPSTNIVAGSSGLDISANYFSKLGDEVDEDFESANLANEIKKLTLRSDFQTQAQPEATAAASKHELPAVVTKKRMRCMHCNKRLNITNIYNCRCGRIFCSQHRYSESHDCKYDYKSEGRKLIEQQNPLVTAPKLTKF